MMEMSLRKVYVVVLMIFVMLFMKSSFVTPDIKEIGLAISCGILAPIIAFFIDSFLVNIANLRMWWDSNVRYRNERVRVSMSYLLRIQINGKFLLVKSSEYDFYQPVGGVYKVLNTDLGYLIERFGWNKDNKYPDSKEKKCDLRGTIPAPKLLPFIKWFKLGKQRETAPWREFYEELINKEILSIKDFPYFEYRHLRIIQPRIKRTENKKLEFFSFDIFDFIPTSTQECKLKNTQNEDSEYIKWVDEQTIENLNARKKTAKEILLGEHTKWIIRER